MSIKVHDNPEKDRDCWQHHQVAYVKDGVNFKVVVAYIPDQSLCDYQDFEGFIEETIVDSETIPFNVQVHHTFSELLEAIDPNFIEMRVSISPKAPLICNDLFCGLTDQPINSMYLSFGKGDWKDYATLRLADPKFS